MKNSTPPTPGGGCAIVTLLMVAGILWIVALSTVAVVA